MIGAARLILRYVLFVLLLIVSGYATGQQAVQAAAVEEPAEATPFHREPGRQQIPLSDISVELAPVAQGMSAPTALVAPPGGSDYLFVVDRSGLIYLMTAGGEIDETPFLDLQERLASPGETVRERGLLGLAFHPDYTENGRLFILYSAPLQSGAPEDGDHTVHVTEFTAASSGRQADLDSERLVARIDRPHPRHNGGRLLFGPAELLYVILSPGAEQGRPEVHCLDLQQAAAPPVECPDEAAGYRQIEAPAQDYLQMKGLDEDNGEMSLIDGVVYQGMAFPSFQGRTIFGAWSVAPDRPEGRLLLATPPRLEGRSWSIEALPIADRENGRLGEFVLGVGQDRAGELYLLTSETAALGENSGNIYKIIPHILSQRSVIEGEPEQYLPHSAGYAQVIRRTPIYRNLDDVRAGRPFGEHGGGSYWVTTHNQTRIDGQTYYYARWAWGAAAWIAGSDLRFRVPFSHLKGVDLRWWQGEPLAMAHRPVHVRSLPGVIEEETVIGALQPYDLVTILETREVNGDLWYRFGPDQWSHSGYLRAFTPRSRPDRIGPDEQWVEVNLPEQTVIAYQGDRPVFATLTSTGRRGYATEPGLFRAWVKLRQGPMQWEEATPPYSLASVPWIIYFNRDQGLHGAYWHDLFGSVRSAGCVNLSPHDAHWLFHWAAPELASGQTIRYLGRDDPALWVWVNSERPDVEKMVHTFRLESVVWPDAALLK